jgi:hypothetical protein
MRPLLSTVAVLRRTIEPGRVSSSSSSRTHRVRDGKEPSAFLEDLTTNCGQLESTPGHAILLPGAGSAGGGARPLPRATGAALERPRPQAAQPGRGKLLDHSGPHPLFTWPSVAYSSLTPMQIVERIESERITRQQMQEFIEKRLETGHTSPLEQCWFEFGIAGVSRAFSHQFVRHRIGISFEQQSSIREVQGCGFPYTVPESVQRPA